MIEFEVGNHVIRAWDVGNEELAVGAVFMGHWRNMQQTYLFHLFVNKKYRRRGIARKMMELALDCIRELGMERASLHVLNEDLINMEFYRSLGFEKESSDYCKTTMIKTFSEIPNENRV